MKSYKKDISKLYETVGFEKIEKGKTYLTAKGGEVKVNDIYIDATGETPEVFSVYEFRDPEGKSGTETNRYSVLVDILRSK